MPTYTNNLVGAVQAPVMSSGFPLSSRHWSGSLAAASADYTSYENTDVCTKGVFSQCTLISRPQGACVLLVPSRAVENGPTSVPQFVI